MAASITLPPAQIELASSLTQDEIPIKLRCAICSKLAINAFRLPCCEQAICEPCQSSLPSSCPVCEHSPLSAEDCTAYKSLRTTIRVFLKTEEKKREKTKGSAPPTPVETCAPAPRRESLAVETTTADTRPGLNGSVTGTPGYAEHSGNVVGESETTCVAPTEATEQVIDGADVSQETPADEQTVDHLETADNAVAVSKQDEETQNSDPVEGTKGDDDGDDGAGNENEESQNGMDFGPNGNPHMNFGGNDMNQMQMMMAMQNGMNPAAFGSFPMMGMGLGMDPMAMQNMYMNGGFGAQGMGMSGMNMNMMNGFGGNDWNGQQSWNVGQDNFNPNAASMGNGDYGNFNSGFRAGYNQGNFGPQNNYNDYGRGGYGFRGRGRGRGRGFHGGYTRGGYNQGYGNHMNTGNWAEQIQQFEANQGHMANDASVPAEGNDEVAKTNVDEFGRTIRPGDSEDGAEYETEVNGKNDQANSGTDVVSKSSANGTSHEMPGQDSLGDAAHSDQVTEYPSAPYIRSQGPHNGPSTMSAPATAPSVPINAPTGPKAMRQGLPNTSLHHLRARGLIQDERSPVPVNGSGTFSPIEAKHPKSRSNSPDHKDRDREHRHDRGRDRDRDEKRRHRDREEDRDHSRAYSGSRSRSRDRDRDHKDSRRRRRHRDDSGSEDDEEHRHRKHRSSKKHSTRDDDDHKSRPKDEKYDERSRSASPDDHDSKRSSHRSRRDRDEKRRDKEKEKDRERDDDYDRSHRKSHRSHRHRDDDRERDRARDKDRKERRDRDRDREHRHRSRRNSVEPPTPLDKDKDSALADASGAKEKSFNPPTGPRGNAGQRVATSSSGFKGFEIKGSSTKQGQSSSSRHDLAQAGDAVSSSRRASQSSATNAHAKSSKDPHTLEREARNRERLLKEAQRIAGLNGLAGTKRNRDKGEADDGGRGRRKSRRGGEMSVEDGEERMRRLEAEREGGRWS